MLEAEGVTDPDMPQRSLLQEATPDDEHYPGDVEVLARLLSKYDWDAKRFLWTSA
jgi:hypothetical protein